MCPTWHCGVALTLPVVFVVASSGEGNDGCSEQGCEESTQAPCLTLTCSIEAAELSCDVQSCKTKTCKGNWQPKQGIIRVK